MVKFRPALILEVEFVLETIRNMVRDHGISLQAETLIKSDQGCHYTSYKFIQVVKDAKLRKSMCAGPTAGATRRKKAFLVI